MKSGAYVRRNLLIILWTGVAGVSLARGFLTSLKAGQSQDLKTTVSWIHTWLQQGRSPYTTGLIANYPPNSIVFLSPLALIPSAWVTLVWSSLNLALAVMAGYLACKLFEITASRKAVLACVMFLAWAGVRIGLGNGQFSLLVLCLGLCAALCVDKYPLLAGLMIGVSLIKPHLGAAFFLWALLTKRFRVCGAAIAALFLAFVVFSLRIRESPLQGAQDFLAVVRLQFAGPNFPVGVSELRPLFHVFISRFEVAEMAYGVFLIGSLVPVILIALDRRALDMKLRVTVVLGLCCLWVLLAFFHNPYDLVLMLPVVLCLQLPALARSALRRNQNVMVALWILQVALVLEIPGLWWKASKHWDLSSYVWTGLLFSNFDRVLILGALLFLINRIRLLAFYRADGDSDRNATDELLSGDRSLAVRKQNAATTI